jgi:hypothetical protein
LDSYAVSVKGAMMDNVGDAVSRALTALTEAPDPAEIYDAVASLLQDAGRGWRLASEAELRQVARDVTEWIFHEHGDSVDDVLGGVIAEVATMLHFNGLYSDEESMKRAARPFVMKRLSPWGMGGRMEVVDPWKE